MTEKQFSALRDQAALLMKKSLDKNHDWQHALRVSANALIIKNHLPPNIKNNLDQKILLLAAAWHDISYAFYRAGFLQYFLESLRSQKIAKKYFQQTDLVPAEIKLLCDIIKRHVWSSWGILNRHRSLYHQIIQDADTAEIFNKSRFIQAQKQAQKSCFWFFVARIFKPLTYGFYLRHQKLIYNLPDIVDDLDKKQILKIDK